MIRGDKIYWYRVFSAAICGTSAMTGFSYLVSELKDENFKEPELLGKLLYRLIPEMNKKYSRIAGWNIHYAVGLLFAILYSERWKKRRSSVTFNSGSIMGGLSGILAIVVWRYTFKLHPAPPKLSFRKFYGHLLIAHIVFGIFASIGFDRICRKNEESTEPGSNILAWPDTTIN